MQSKPGVPDQQMAQPSACGWPYRDCRNAAPWRTCVLCHVTQCDPCSAVTGTACQHCERWYCGRVECDSHPLDTAQDHCCTACRDEGDHRRRCSLCQRLVDCSACAARCPHLAFCTDESCSRAEFVFTQGSTDRTGCTLCDGRTRRTRRTHRAGKWGARAAWTRLFPALRRSARVAKVQHI